MKSTALACGLLASALLVPAGAASAHRIHGDAERRVAHQINHFRAANGRAKLRISPALSRSAHGWSRHLMRTDRYGHSSQSLASGGWKSRGEVIALRMSWRRSARWPLNAWTGSGGHAAVLLHPGFRAIGVGRVAGRFGRRRATIWTVQVGRR